MSYGVAAASHQTFDDNSGNKITEEESSEKPLPQRRMAHDNTVEKAEINSNLEHTQNPRNDTTKVAEDKERQELVKMDNSSSTTMSLLAATYSSSEILKDETVVNLDEEPSSPTVSTSSSRVSTRYNGQVSKDYGKPSKKYTFRPKKKNSNNNNPIQKRKNSLRQNWKLLNQRKAEKRERLRLEAEKLKDIELNDIIETVVRKPVLPSPLPLNTDSEDTGYIKGKYHFRNVKRPLNYHPDALQAWNAKHEEEKEKIEQQKLLEFKEEKKMTDLLRKKNNKAKKMKLLNEKDIKNGYTLTTNETFVKAATSQNSNNETDTDDVKIVKVVTKPKANSSPTSSKFRINLEEFISDEREKRKKEFRVLHPASRSNRPPVVCFPSSSIRRAPLHTLPVIRKKSSIICAGASQSEKPFTDDCFTFIPCSTSSSSTSSSTVTVPPPKPPIYSTTSKRVSFKKKELSELGSESDVQETVADECFRSVPCSTPSTVSSATSSLVYNNQSKFITTSQSNTFAKPSPPGTVFEAAVPFTDDCFKSVPCSSSVSTVHMNPQTTITAPISNQPTFIPQFSTIPATTLASIATPPLQSSEYQTITIPPSMLPPPGTPLQIVFVLPNGAAQISNNNNANISSPPIVIPQQPSTIPLSSSPTDVKPIKSEIK
uniref:Uncharacterized protein n=1 Tax=Panagrolaimus superbus TaxID=310955 RepID=A0A914YSS7_9BILA